MYVCVCEGRRGGGGISTPSRMQTEIHHCIQRVSGVHSMLHVSSSHASTVISMFAMKKVKHHFILPVSMADLTFVNYCLKMIAVM